MSNETYIKVNVIATPIYVKVRADNIIERIVEVAVPSPGPPGDPGADGLSAYEVAVNDGFVGNEAAWLLSLVGAQGDPGIQGPPGEDAAATLTLQQVFDNETGTAVLDKDNNIDTGGFDFKIKNSTNGEFSNSNKSGLYFSPNYAALQGNNTNYIDIDGTAKRATVTLDGVTKDIVTSVQLNGTPHDADISGLVDLGTLTKSDVGLSNVDNTSDTNKPISTAQQTVFDLKADLVSGKVPSTQLPAYVDDVLEYANLAALPVTGTAGIIYITLDDNLEYRWTGSAYVNIAKGDVQSVAGRTGVVVLTSTDVGLGNVDNVSDANKPVSTLQATADALNLKIASNLSDLNNAATARTNLGLGTLATQSGTFSGTSSGTNTGDETLATIKTKLGITTLSGSNTGDQDLSSYLTNALLNGKIFVGNVSNIAAAVTPSGDVTIDNTGITGIGALKVTNGMLAGSIADAKISSAATWNAKQAAISLTTTGMSGAATFVSNTLNIPNYSSTDTLTIGKALAMQRGFALP